tara:strand:- start:398 stop:553 length:156 start_codon:yes stop_codon:yes gene_type:complete
VPSENGKEASAVNMLLKLISLLRKTYLNFSVTLSRIFFSKNLMGLILCLIK